MPKFSDGLRRFLNRDDVTLKASGAEATSTAGAAVELGDKATLNLVLDVTASSGTPTLDVTVEGSDEPIPTNWYTLGTFAQKTGISAERKAFPAARHVRYRSTIGGGTPSLTYSITGDAA